MRQPKTKITQNWRHHQHLYISNNSRLIYTRYYEICKHHPNIHQGLDQKEYPTESDTRMKTNSKETPIPPRDKNKQRLSQEIPDATSWLTTGAREHSWQCASVHRDNPMGYPHIASGIKSEDVRTARNEDIQRSHPKCHEPTLSGTLMRHLGPRVDLTRPNKDTTNIYTFANYIKLL